MQYTEILEREHLIKSVTHSGVRGINSAVTPYSQLSIEKLPLGSFGRVLKVVDVETRKRAFILVITTGRQPFSLAAIKRRVSEKNMEGIRIIPFRKRTEEDLVLKGRHVYIRRDGKSAAFITK